VQKLVPTRIKQLLFIFFSVFIIRHDTRRLLFRFPAVVELTKKINSFMFVYSFSFDLIYSIFVYLIGADKWS